MFSALIFTPCTQAARPSQAHCDDTGDGVQLRGGAHHQPCTSGTTLYDSTTGHACMHAVNYKIYSGHGDSDQPGGTAGTHTGYMDEDTTLAATGEYQYDLAQASSASRCPPAMDTPYLGTAHGSASRSSRQHRAPGRQDAPVASLESRILKYSTRVLSSRDPST